MKDLIVVFLIALGVGAAVNYYQTPVDDGGGASAAQSESGGTAESIVQPVTDATFEQYVIKSQTPVLVDFYATWCGPCKRMAPIVEQLASENSGRLKVFKLDIDANQQMASKFQANSIPVFYIFKNGEAVDRIEGAKPKEVLAAALAKVTGAAPAYDAFSSAPPPGNNTASSDSPHSGSAAVPAGESAIAANNEDVPMVDETGFDRDVIKSASPVLVFFCDGSDACKRTWPTVVAVANKVYEKYRVVRVDVTAHPALASEYYVAGTPTFMIFKNGQRYKQMTGVPPERDLLSFLEVQHTASAKVETAY